MTTKATLLLLFGIVSGVAAHSCTLGHDDCINTNNTSGSILEEHTDDTHLQMVSIVESMKERPRNPYYKFFVVILWFVVVIIILLLFGVFCRLYMKWRRNRNSQNVRKWQPV